MKRSFRGADQLFRFGGEEFVVLLEHASEAGALIVLERLRAIIEEHDFPQVGHVPISVGYTRIDRRDVATTCVERADAALYYIRAGPRLPVRDPANPDLSAARYSFSFLAGDGSSVGSSASVQGSFSLLLCGLQRARHGRRSDVVA